MQCNENTKCSNTQWLQWTMHGMDYNEQCQWLQWTMNNEQWTMNKDNNDNEHWLHNNVLQ